MDLLRPEPGDVILNPNQMGDYQVAVPHSVIWIGEGQYCTAEANDGNVNGLKLGERKLFEAPRYYDSLINHVFRCTDRRVGQKAAEYAHQWAVATDDVSHTHKAKTYRQVVEEGEKAVLPTPYNMRLRKKEWTPAKGLFDAAKAWVRAQQKIPLSFNQGMGCAGFVTYCYQVASLEEKGGHQMVMTPALEEFIMLKNEANVAWLEERGDVAVLERLADPRRKKTHEYEKLRQLKEQARVALEKKLAESHDGLLAPEFLIDAAAQRTKNLYDILTKSKDFEFVGYLIGNQAKGKSDKVGIIRKQWVDELTGTMASKDEQIVAGVSEAKGWF